MIFGDQIDASEVLAAHGDLHLSHSGAPEAKVVEEKKEYA